MSKKELRCSFCSKSQRDVKKLVAGQNVQICDECIDICVDVIAEDRKDAAPPPHHADARPERAGYPGGGVPTGCALCHMLTPLEHLVLIHSRGVLCHACLSAVEAAIEANRNRLQ